MESKVLLGNGARNELRESLGEILSLEKHPWRVRMLTLNFSDFELFRGITLREIIKRLARRGVITTIVVGSKPSKKDTTSYEEQIRFYEELLDEGVEIYYNDKVHAKVILAEGKTENSALIMSANLTKSGLFYNYEAGVFLSPLKDEDYKSLRNYTSDIVGAPIKTKPIEMVF